MARHWNYPKLKRTGRKKGVARGGPEFFKWCSDESPVRSFVRGQRRARRDAAQAAATRETREPR